MHWRGPWLAPFGIALGVWIIAGAVSEWATRVKLFAVGADETWRRARGLPRSAYGSTLAHAGIGLTLLGIVATAAWQSESVVTMRAGEATEIAGYELTFRGVAPGQGPNYQEQVGLLTVTRGGSAVTQLSPAKRLYDAPRQPTTEAAIHVALAGDLYVVLGDELKDGGWVVRLYFNPLVRLIWLGAIVMALGGALSLSDRRRARREAEGPRAGGARPPHLPGAALPRLSEPVDRRLQRRACPRPARPRARAHRRRRQRRCCAHLRRGPLRRVRPPAPAPAA